MSITKKSLQVGDREIIITTGHLAKQASGSCTIQCGDTVALVTAVVSGSVREGIDFLPLTCDYIEKTYSAGKIPGGFFKREGKPSEREVLVSRLIDRPLRPLFPKGFFNEVQIIATVLSIDHDHDPDVLSIIGASFALEQAGVPFKGPIGSVRAGMIDGQIVINPPRSQMDQSALDVIVAGSEEAIVMVEGRAEFVSEKDFIEALDRAHAEIKKIAAFQKNAAKEMGIVKPVFSLPAIAGEIEKIVADTYTPAFKEKLFNPSKKERSKGLGELNSRIMEDLKARFPEEPSLKIWAGFAMEKVEKDVIRRHLFETGKRIDGRNPEDIRQITCELGILPRTHGSAVFTRGETQALVVTTLGTADDEQKIDALLGETYKSFMLHYNFTPFSTGETKPLRSPGRREVGHGALAERALWTVMPKEKSFPYTVRVVSDILESNGSSSMASVCGGSLSLMDAGVPIKEHVSGIAMGLVMEGDRAVVLSDILGDEDHVGDMDFKVCGTKDGITAVQMDMKVAGVTREVLTKALEQARQGRLHILGKMQAAIEAPRPQLSVYAPRVYTLKIKQDRIRDLIGPGGKNIRAIIDQTGVDIDIEDDGTVNVFSSNSDAADKALDLIKKHTFEPELGAIYMGKVVRIVDFGAFVQLGQGVDGLLHISQIAPQRVKQVTDVLKEGDIVPVKVIDIDSQGRIKLSRKEALGVQQNT